MRLETRHENVGEVWIILVRIFLLFIIFHSHTIRDCHHVVAQKSFCFVLILCGKWIPCTFHVADAQLCPKFHFIWRTDELTRYFIRDFVLHLKYFSLKLFHVFRERFTKVLFNFIYHNCILVLYTMFSKSSLIWSVFPLLRMIFWYQHELSSFHFHVRGLKDFHSFKLSHALTQLHTARSKLARDILCVESLEHSHHPLRLVLPQLVLRLLVSPLAQSPYAQQSTAAIRLPHATRALHLAWD